MNGYTKHIKIFRTFAIYSYIYFVIHSQFSNFGKNFRTRSFYAGNLKAP